jgi:hypothetical protein
MSRNVFPKSLLLAVAACAALAAAATPSAADVEAGQSSVIFDPAIASTAVSAATVAVPSPGVESRDIFEVARHGADDPVGDDRGGKRGGKGRGGHDDGPNHT